MEILKKDNIVKVLIAIIIILGVIFIIVGERPRHKADVKTPSQNQPEKPQATASEPAESQSSTKEATPPKPEPEETDAISDIKNDSSPAQAADNAADINKIDGKQLIHEKYKNSDQTFLQNAIDEHNAQKKSQVEEFSAKNDVNSDISESGISTDSANLGMDTVQEEKIAKEEGSPSEDVKSLTALSNPDIKDSDNINPAIAKAEKIQYENPQKYATSTAVDTSAVYAVNTETAETYMLKKGDTEWRKLGKPEGVSSKPIATYTLEGANADSTVVLDTSTAEAWRVTVTDDNISWNVIKPFADKE